MPVAPLFSEVGVYQGEALLEDQAADTLAVFQGLSDGVRPEQVAVAVASPDARHAAELLERGFVANGTDAQGDGATRVVFGPSQREEALLLTRYLETVPRFEVVVDAGIRLEVGPDFAGIRQFPRPQRDVAPAVNGAFRAFTDAVSTTTVAPDTANDPGLSDTSTTVLESESRSSVTSIVVEGSTPLPSASIGENSDGTIASTVAEPSSTTVVRGRPLEGVTCQPTGG